MKLINDAGLRKALTDFYAKLKDMFATKTEVYNRATTDAKLAKKSDTGHTHDDRYYTETEVNDKLATKASTSHNHDTVYTKQYIGTVTNFVDCTTPGTYFVGSETTLPNGPYVGKIYGNLVVFKGNGAGDVVLQVFFDTPGTIFMRHKRGGKWDPWRKVFSDTSKPTWDDVTSKPSIFNPAPHSHDDKYYTEAEINTKVSALNDAIAAKAPTGHLHDDKYMNLHKGTVTDFNTVLAKGMYYISSATALPNSPEPASIYGIMEVLPLGNAGYIFQRVTTSVNKMYVRYYDLQTKTFSKWSSFYNTNTNKVPWGDIIDKPTKFTPEAHNHNSNYYRVDLPIATGDFNNYYTINGHYNVSSPTSITNAPYTGNIYGTLQVLIRFSGAATQIFIDDQCKEYIRHRDSTKGAWTQWVKVFTTAQKPTWDEVTNKPTTFNAAPHTHDDRYYTETEINNKVSELQASIGEKAPVNHDHDGRYFRIGLIKNSVTDFNNCLSNGKFGVGSETSIPNAPYTGAIYGFLEVVGYGSEYVQTFYTKPGMDVYVRQYSQNKWSAWKKTSMVGHNHNNEYYPKAEIDSKVSTINATLATKAPNGHNHDDRYYTENEIDAKVSELQGNIDSKSPSSHVHDNLYVRMQDKLLTDGGDFNEFFAIGIYPVSGRNIKNAPYEGGDLWGVLEVIKRNGDLGIIQRYTGTNGVVYHRYITADSIVNISDNENIETFVDEEGTTWSIGGWIKSFSANCPPQWNEVTFKPSTFPAAPHTHDDRYFTETEINDKIKVINDTISTKAPSVHLHDDKYMNLCKGKVDDFNKVLTKGMYYIASDTPLPNSPISTYIYGILEVLPLGDNGYLFQRCTTNGGGVYSRYYDHGTKKFTEWFTHYTSGVKPNWEDVQNRPATMPPSTHTHDDRYYTETEINNKVSALQNNIDAKAPSNHNHDTKYFRTDLPTLSTENFDSYYTISGRYNVSCTTSMPNSPTPGAIYGMLLVYVRSEGCALQHFISTGGQEYTRWRDGNSGKWKPWTKVFSAVQLPTWNDITDKPTTMAPTAHTHDDRYFTETEMNEKIKTINDSIATKAAANHNHDNKYYKIDLPTITTGDLNNYYTVTGTYVVSSTTNIVNSPISGNINAFLHVFVRSTGYATQRFTEQAGREFMRHRDAKTGTWTPWCKIFSTGQKPAWDDIINKPTTFAPSAHSHDDKYYTEAEINSKISTINNDIASKANSSHLHDDRYTRSMVETLTNGADFNTRYKTTGVYSVSATSTTNGPTSGALYGTLLVYVRSTNDATQIYISNDGKQYVRHRNTNGVWDSWSKVYSDMQKPTWGDIEGKPSTFAPATHNHNNDYAIKKIVEQNTGNGRLFNQPLAILGHSIASHKGPVKITLPVSWTSTMIGFDLITYNYAAYTGKSIYHLSGYNYNPTEGGRWVNPTVATTGATVTSSVRFGHDGKKCCIIIGDKNTTWQYPKFVLTDLMIGQNEINLPEWETGWKIELITDETGITGLTWASNTTGAHRHDSQYFRSDLKTITAGDFNDYYIDEGYHNVSSSTGIKNAPHEGGIWGLLKVEGRSAGDVNQTYTDCYGKEWKRHRNASDNTWSPWIKVYSELQKPSWNEVQNKPSTFKPESHIHDDRYVSKISKGNVTDFNNSLNEGKYMVTSDTSIPNAPWTGAIYGSLFVILRNADPIQIFIDAAGGATCIRHWNASSKKFYEWYTLVTSKDLSKAMDAKIPSGARITKEGDDFYINW